MMKSFVFYLLAICLVHLINGQEPRDCDLPSCKGKPHTLCKYYSTEPSADCQEMGDSELSEDDKDTIIKYHNDKRAFVASGQETRGKNGGQPAATNMGSLTWNDSLAETAQRWAIQCKSGHDDCKNIGDVYVGQNVAWYGWSDSWHDDLLIPLMDEWYNEVDNFDKDLLPAISFPPGPVIGHYTQLVWAKTTDIGCGIVRYHREGEYYSTNLVCNYAPGGNVNGAPVYGTT